MTQVIPLWREVVPMVRGLFIITDPGRDQDNEDTLVASLEMSLQEKDVA